MASNRVKVPTSSPSMGIITLMVQWSDGTWEDMHFQDEVEARAFALAVQTYHRTGIGEEWHGDICRIYGRQFGWGAN